MLLKVKSSEDLQTVLEELRIFLTEAQLLEDIIFESKLVACELLGNVLRHAGGETALYCQTDGDCVEMKIYSEREFFLPETIVCSNERAENGRGLFLVNEICQGQMTSEKDGIRVRICVKKV